MQVCLTNIYLPMFCGRSETLKCVVIALWVSGQVATHLKAVMSQKQDTCPRGGTVATPWLETTVLEQSPCDHFLQSTLTCVSFEVVYTLYCLHTYVFCTWKTRKLPLGKVFLQKDWLVVCALPGILGRKKWATFLNQCFPNSFYSSLFGISDKVLWIYCHSVEN